MRGEFNIFPNISDKGIGELPFDKTKGWSLLNEEVSLPVAVIDQKKLTNNIRWMQQFADVAKVKLAPHGKTSMTAAIFKQQLAQGAWGMTLATAPQVVAAANANIKRIIMANQLVGKHNMTLINDAISRKKLDFYCLVDSVDNVHALGEFFQKTQQSINILIEIGVEGGRCGCRTLEQVLALYHAAKPYSMLKLSGIEVYEGVISGENAEQKITKFLKTVVDYAQVLHELSAFVPEKFILTGAGSAWYDIVAREFASASSFLPIEPIIRPGCYVTHDVGIYQKAQAALLARCGTAHAIDGELQSALEVWAYVQSIPEPGQVIVGIGKRDVAFDAGLPQATKIYRQGYKSPINCDIQWQVIKVMDQHAFMSVPKDADIKIGDMVAFSTSHPCLTFDKWRWLCLVDDNYRVVDVMNTQF